MACGRWRRPYSDASEKSGGSHSAIWGPVSNFSRLPHIFRSKSRGGTCATSHAKRGFRPSDSAYKRIRAEIHKNKRSGQFNIQFTTPGTVQGISQWVTNKMGRCSRVLRSVMPPCTGLCRGNLPVHGTGEYLSRRGRGSTGFRTQDIRNTEHGTRSTGHTGHPGAHARHSEVTDTSVTAVRVDELFNTTVRFSHRGVIKTCRRDNSYGSANC